MAAVSRSRVDVVLAYHERSKHRPGHFARAPERIDWDAQPSPFRIYDGAPNVFLDEVPVAETSRLAIERGATLGPAYDELFLSDAVAPAKLSFENLSQFLYDSLALVAWKRELASARKWATRVNPSHGDLFPTEAYLVVPAIPSLGPKPAVYHYSPLLHSLEVRRDLSPEDWEDLAIPLPTDAFLVGLTSIVWREAWKFGERAFRYCQHDIGHAIGALALSAAALGWQVRRIVGLVDTEIAQLVGIHGQRGPEAEEPEVLLAIAPSFGDTESSMLPTFPLAPLSREFLARARAAEWRGTPNVLSASHHDWPILSVVNNATRQHEPEGTIPPPPPSSTLPEEKAKTFDDELPLAFTRIIREKGKLSLKVGGAWQPTFELIRVANEELVSPWRKSCADVRPALARVLIRRRRSASAMSGRLRIGKDVFVRILARTMPTVGHPVFDALGRAPAVHLLLFVHRVRELTAGLYLLARDASQLPMLRSSFSGPYLWKVVETPQNLPLFLLERGDVRALARTSSCHEALASEAAFGVSMLAEFEPRLRQEGTPGYRSLHWEAGAVGQMLYLEAEAASLRGAGMGAFFDDLVHESLGIGDRSLQTLYHFAVGASADDPRTLAAPPYEHRREVFEP